MSEQEKRTKGMANGTPLRYWSKPSPIIVYRHEGHCVCDNCGGWSDDHPTYEIDHNQTDNRTANGSKSSMYHAKLRTLVLCEDCLDELLDAIYRATGKRKTKEPTERQLRFIKAICEVLGLSEPVFQTREEASEFISKNIEAYKEEVCSLNQSTWAIENGYD